MRTTTNELAPPALPPAPGARVETSTIPGTPLVPFPGRDHRRYDNQTPNVPPGTTLAQYSRERRAEIERGADVWMVSFARKYADAPMRLRNSWKGRLGEMSLAQVLDKRAEVRSQASGLAQTLTMLDASARVLAAYPEFHSIDEFNAAQKLPALGPTHVTPTIRRTAPEQEEL